MPQREQSSSSTPVNSMASAQLCDLGFRYLLSSITQYSTTTAPILKKPNVKREAKTKSKALSHSTQRLENDFFSIGNNRWRNFNIAVFLRKLIRKFMKDIQEGKTNRLQERGRRTKSANRTRLNGTPSRIVLTTKYKVSLRVVLEYLQYTFSCT